MEQEIEIYTELTNKEIETILNTTEIQIQWDIFNSLEGNKELEEEKDKVKYGIKTYFDIRSILEKQYKMEPAQHRIRIERKQIINLIDYRNEMDERKKIMRNTIRKLYNNTFDNQEEEEIEGYE